MYIGDYLGRRAIYSPDKIAIIDYGKNPEWRLTYRQMNERAIRRNSQSGVDWSSQLFR
jgi:fatty-acyl-CoA synthase